jgi:hypothetical protein
MADKHFTFQLENPQKGIVAFNVTVAAEDAESAVWKLFESVVDWKRRHTIPPKPISHLTSAKEIADEALRRLNSVSEPTAFILTAHLLSEYWLNRLLRHAFPNRDLSRYDFFKKVEILFGMGQLPQHLFVNLTKLNDLRVKIAHNVDYDLTQMDLNYQGCDVGWELSGYKPSYAPDAGQHHIFNVLTAVLFATFTSLHNHCVSHLKLGQGSFWQKEHQMNPPGSGSMDNPTGQNVRS